MKEMENEPDLRHEIDSLKARITQLEGRSKAVEHSFRDGIGIGSPHNFFVSRSNTRFDYAGIPGIRSLDLLSLSPDGFYPLYYLQAYPDLRTAFGPANIQAAIDHYMSAGIAEGRDPSPFFSPGYYLETYPDLRASFGNDYAAARKHWATAGFREGRRGSPNFDIGYYLSSHADLTQHFGSTGFDAAFDHWKRHGNAERRRTTPTGGLTVVYYLGNEQHISQNPGTLHALTGYIRGNESGATYSQQVLTGGEVFLAAAALLVMAHMAYISLEQQQQALNVARLNALNRQLYEGSQRLEREAFREMDRRNYESERIEQTRNTALA